MTASKVYYADVQKQKEQQQKEAIPSSWILDNLPGPEHTDVSNFVFECGLLSKEEEEILRTPARKLVESMISKKLKSYDVTLAFCRAAAIAHQVVNPLTEIFFQEGLLRAQQLDKHLESTGKPLGPLHGLPVSIKDCFNIKGYDATIGFSGYANQPAESESVVVEILRDAGAVFYCKTNIPHAMLRGESYNDIFGRTLNPYNRNLTAGGSSGGEGALVGISASPLGVGTDIGGSVRIPAAYNNQFGLKPSSGRIPLYGGKSSLPGQESIPATAGPMSKELDSLELFCKTVIDAQPWDKDPKCIPLPWRQVEIPSKLTIGIIEDDGVVKPTPPVLNTLKRFVELLKSAGHNVVQMPNLNQKELLMVKDKLMRADGAANMKKCFEMGSEPWPAALEGFRNSNAVDISEYWQLQAFRTSWQKSVLEIWDKTKIDCIISPAAVFCAAEHDKAVHTGYTSVWNVADFSAGVFPVTRVTAELAKPYENYTPREGDEKKVYSEYDPKKLLGAAVSLQVVCKRLEEEKTLKILKVMADIAKNF